MTHIEAAKELLRISGGTSHCLLRVSLLFGAIDITQKHAVNERKKEWSKLVPDMSEWLSPDMSEERTQEMADLLGIELRPDRNFLEDYRASRVRDIESHSEKDGIGVASSIRAAALILTHSHIDESLNHALHTCVTFDTEGWIDRIVSASGSTFTLRGALNFDREAELAKATRHYINGAKHQSLPKRYALLRTYCFESGGKFNRELLPESEVKEFDERRHKLIHNVGFLHDTVESGVEVQCRAMLAALNDLTFAMFDVFEIRQYARNAASATLPS